ncbi:MAG: replication associated protein [Wigfec virus K19_292]|nr:MAG: replication associated protein [Wigfec virus K19_292]
MKFDADVPLACDNRAQFRSWCFTLNGTHKYDALNKMDDWQYMVAGKEVAPSTGTKHLQCYVYFNKRKTFAAVKKMCPRAHFIVCKGNADQNRRYCIKDGDYSEIGKFPEENGGKVKAEKFRAMIDLTINGNIDDVMDIDPISYVQHYHAFKRIKQDHPSVHEKLPGVCGEWIYGNTGAGKSYLARQENSSIYDKPCNKWFDGYLGEDTILLDDFDKNHVMLGHHLKRWADRYPFPAEQKGTTIQVRPSKVVVTSNYSIDEIFGHDAALCDALKRRFKERLIIKPASWTQPLIAGEVHEDEYSLDLDTI